ncbi:wax ester/triacylglycerol synthase family O-acyltransferase [Exilibacterium tricleocarpae]|uniref:diacylglycerol O-acyltransferase n=1 Tax=Exilibacterium tricleocarpae TaxID=2591008 RepID=A0A545U5E8_9GAMM|nr:wax ester/triacylglycerol synthase family O-acyltransferase [Exilibacterium tricleocarpae]TQV84687.1 wax ester/triacylglycerol synthase family O-acyltransferase [Exilibacterium tricleocarpae]
MQQLSGMDASFLYFETANMPMHIGGLQIYDQSTAPDGQVGFKDILRFFESRLHKAPSFRRRAVRVPLGADHPYWIEDPEFDLEFHVRHVALPRPGDWRQLCIETSRLLSRPLDERKPLWEAYIIEGLDNVEGMPKGAFAMLTKIHHACVDGLSGAEIAKAIHDTAPGVTVEPPQRPWVAERLPTGMELFGRTLVSGIKRPFQFARLVGTSIPVVKNVAEGFIKRELKLNLRVPRTRFNEAVSPHRVFDGRSFDLEEIRAIKTAVAGATVNDVAVAVCGGALRKYLQAKNELPAQTCVAMAPISVRTEAQRHDAGNLVSAMSLPIRSDIEDPLERLRAVHEESQQAKKLAATVGGQMAVEAAQFLPAAVVPLAVRAYERSGLNKRVPALVNCIITNVPSANFPLYSMGCEMVAHFGLGPITHGVGLFQPIVSYNGRVTISAVSCRDMMPDPAFYMECLEAAYDELKLAAIGEPEVAAEKKSAPKKRAARRPTKKSDPAP